MLAKKHWLTIALLFLLLNSGYLRAFDSPTVFYVGNVLLHLAVGIGVMAWAGLKLRQGAASRWGLLLLLASGAAGLYLAIFGNLLAMEPVLIAHFAAGVVAVALLAMAMPERRTALAMGVLFAGLFPLLMAAYSKVRPDPRDRITNPEFPPMSMAEEGGGPKSPFAPSSAQTNTGGKIPSNFFMDSARCGECHKDVYEQWNSSMHHFASFNNQFYRKSIEYMQDVVGTEPSRWCAGCHDHAMLFNGKFDTPAKEQIDTPEAQTGLGCMSCHSIVQVDSSMGNGGFMIEYPPLHDLANSKNKTLRAIHDFITYLNPKPHRRVFLKPFMRQDAAEFCSACHKVHLDEPVNQYRWVRGFNDYDNWQASGVSGQGARSFYYPPKSQTCVDCHMPLVESKDPGNRDGKVHQHRFLGANTAVPYVNGDAAQLKTAQDFLQSGIVSADIFAISPIEPSKETPMMRRAGETGPQLMSSIAVGEEGEQQGAVVVREVGKIAAPIDAAGAKVKAGTSVRVDVVVRTRKLGHFFPGGTVDAFDLWVELVGKDAAGNVIFWSGRADDNGSGPVEPGAHFYRAYQLDGDGNPINKRNAWQMRSLLYARMIPPGAADTVHFRVDIPASAKGPITLEAKVNHRKFAHYYTQFSYAGEPLPGQEASLLTAAHNSLEYGFSPRNIPKNVSGKIKGAIPALPITVIADAKATLELGEPDWKPVVRKQDRERWNDWGIGLLLQGDLKGAEYGFQRVTEAEPEYADGWINVARALIQEGETDAAKPYLAKGLERGPNLGRAHYFQALVQKTDGDYDAALASLNRVVAQYPRDRVVLNQKARIQFLKRDYAGALETIRQVRSVDPEDLQSHYTAMLAYRGLGKTEEAMKEEKLFRRFKIEESAQSITAKRRLISPEDNNERQMIHDHVSVKLEK